MKQLYTTLLVIVTFALLGVTDALAQCSAYNLNTPGTTPTCLSFSGGSASSSSICAGAGHGGSGQVRIVRFCTNATAQCVSFDFTGLNALDGTSIALYSGCSLGTLSGLIAGSGNCYVDQSNIGWSTAGLALAPNTCYFLRVWTKNAPTAGAQVCANVESPTNDFCTAPQQIGTAPVTYDNYCMTAGTAGDPTPAQFCAGSLENNAWFSFTTLSTCTFPCTVTITISGISCSGGGSGFQIGYWTGVCGALTNIGCTAGAGGSVTATITNLNPSQTVIVGLDGNAGAYCNFTISGTNIVSLPVGLSNFTAMRTSSGVQLDWQTLSEQNNDYFTIERSVDGENWSAIHTEDGMENSSSLKNYTHVDGFVPKSSILYYRLSQTDLNGTTQVLKTVTVDENNPNNILEIVPNPAVENQTTVKFNSQQRSTTKLAVYDFTGAVVFESEYETEKGLNQFKLSTNGLSKGVYLVKVQNSTEYAESKLIVN